MKFWRCIQNNTLLRKTIVIGLLVAVIGGVALPVIQPSAHTAHAQAQVVNPLQWLQLALLGKTTATQLVEWTFDGVAEPLLQSISLGALSVSAFFVGLSGLLLNESINFTIVRMATIVDKITSLDLAWQLFRDAINMIFIFVVLFIAISIILRLERYGQRKLLVSIVIAALLINFSLFFTRVIIDTSNVLAYEFYKPVQQLSGTNNVKLGTLETRIDDFTGAFVERMHITTIYSELEASSEDDSWKIVIFQAGATVFLMIVAFVFFAIALLLLMRFVVLILLLVSSPLAFFGMILPKGENISNRWWSTLLDQAIWPVVFMLLISISYLIISDPTFVQNTTPRSGGKTFVSAFTGDGEGSVLVVLNFVIVIGFLIASLLVAKSFSANTSKGVTNWATRTAGRATFGTLGAVGRQSFGRLGRFAADSGTLNRWAKSDNPFARRLGRGLVRSGDAFAKSSFDVRAGIKNTAYLDIGKAQKGGRRKQFDTAVKREGGYEKKMKAPAVSDETQRLVTESKKELKRKRAELAQLKEQRESGKGMASERSLDQRQKRLEREMRMAQDQIKGAKKQRWSERAEGMVGTHKLKLFKAALGMKPLDAAEARELGKKELDREKLNAQLQKARAKAKSTSGDESKAAHQEASRLQSELDELNGGINQLNDQQRTYFNAYVRYEKAELRQKESTKQLKQQSADKDVGAPSVVRRVAGQKARKELNKGKNESIFEKLVREEVEKQEGNTKDKEDEE